MVEEAAHAHVQFSDPGHVRVGELEPEHIEVLLHPLLADGLGNDHDAACRIFSDGQWFKSNTGA